MEGWRPVEELTRWAFAHAQVVMANEPDPLGRRTGVDALVVSADNTLT